MRRICSPGLPNSVVALVVVSAMAASAGIGHARAEDCLAAPNAASPPGQHWYYRIDRVKQRKCWYLHAPLRIAHHHGAAVLESEAVARPASAAPMSAIAAPMPAMSAPKPVMAAPAPAVNAPALAISNAPTLPQVTALAVKTIAVRPAGARTQSHRGGGDASIQEASARAYSATSQRKSEAPLFFVLVFSLGAATFLMAIVIKCVAPRASWPLRPARSGADIAWPQGRRHYSGAGPVWLKPRSPG